MEAVGQKVVEQTFSHIYSEIDEHGNKIIHNKKADW